MTRSVPFHRPVKPAGCAGAGLSESLDWSAAAIAAGRISPQRGQDKWRFIDDNISPCHKIPARQMPDTTECARPSFRSPVRIASARILLVSNHNPRSAQLICCSTGSV